MRQKSIHGRSHNVSNSDGSVENNGKQRATMEEAAWKTKTGRGFDTWRMHGLGFLPGKSGNPGGRPRSKGLVNALRAKLGESRPDGRTTEEHLVSALIEEALRGKHRVAAIEAILDRLEGKPKQQLDVNNITDDIRRRPTEDLRFNMGHGHWPEDACGQRHGLATWE
jgi:uncharacterized protein DUF5681